MAENTWVGFDLDGTLAYYDRWRGAMHIGEPIPSVVARAKEYLAQGIEVRIVTARAVDGGAVVTNIEDWTERVFGVRLKVTCCKDYQMIRLYDDRAVHVPKNQGLA